MRAWYLYPSDDLAGIVKYYWFVDTLESKTNLTPTTISPSGYPELIFNFGSTPTLDIKNTVSNKAPLSFIAGQITQPVELVISSFLSCICVKLKPYALPLLFGYNSHEFTDSATDLSNLDNQEADRIYDRLSEAINDSQRLLIIENFLRLRLKQNKASSFGIPDMVNEIMDRNGLISFDDLTEKMSFSPSTFLRRFKNQVGMSPKYFIRIVRFNYVFYLLKCNSGLSLQDIVYQCGYYDLSHLINEFHEFSGTSPYKYFRNSNIFNDFFAGIR